MQDSVVTENLLDTVHEHMQDNVPEVVQENVQSEEDNRHERTEYFLYYSPDCTFDVDRQCASLSSRNCTFDVDRQCANLSSRYGTLHEDRQCAYLSMSNVDLNLLDGVQEARSPEPPPPVAGQNIIQNVHRSLLDGVLDPRLTGLSPPVAGHKIIKNMQTHVPECSDNMVHDGVFHEPVASSDDIHVMHAGRTGTWTSDMDHNVQRTWTSDMDHNVQRRNVQRHNMQRNVQRPNVHRHLGEYVDTSETMCEDMLQYSPAGQDCTDRTENSVLDMSGQNDVIQSCKICRICR